MMQGQRRKMKGEGIQHPGGKEEQGRGCHGEAENEAAGEQSGRQGADGGARIQRVDIGIDQAVEGHGGRARGDHGNADPAEGAQRGNSVGGDDGAGEPEGKREKGMLPLDHLKRDAGVVKNLRSVSSEIRARAYCIRWRETYAPWRCGRHLKRKRKGIALWRKDSSAILESKVPALCFGGNVFGWTADEARSFELLDALLESGLNFVDTADVYSHWAPGNHGGESETILGKWFKARGNREQVILATKVGSPMGEGKKGLSRRYIRQAVEDSLRRLQTDYIDLYQSHRDDESTPQEETLGVYAELIPAGQGARDWSFELYRRAAAIGAGGEPQAQPFAL